MKKRMNFTFDEKTIEFLHALAKKEGTTMSGLLESIIWKECRRRLRRECTLHPAPPAISKDNITPVDVAQVIVNKLFEKGNGGDIPQDFKILDVSKVAKEKRWKHDPPLEAYKILIETLYKGTQAFVYYPECKLVCRITKSDQRMRFLDLR